MSASIQSSNAAAQTRWANKVYTQHFDLNMFRFLTTPSDSGTLQGAIIKEDFPPQSGETVVYHFRNPLAVSGVKTGDTRVQGTGADIQRGTDTFSLTRRRFETPIRNYTQSQQRTKHDLMAEAAEELASVNARYTASQVLTQLTDTTTGRTQDRYLYGNSEDNWNSTHATAMANVNATDGKLSLNLLDDIAVKMKTGGAGRGFINPASVMTKKGAAVNQFVGLFHPKAIRDLKRDSYFRTDVMQKENPDFDVISGANFVGMYAGILIYELGPIDGDTDNLLVSGAGASGINLAHNLILGAQAVAIGYGQVKKPQGDTKYSMEDKGRMMITTVDDDHGGDTLMASTTYMGFKKLVDNSSGTSEDFGVAHLFTSAV